MESIKSSLNHVRGRDTHTDMRGKEAAPKPESEHLEQQTNDGRNYATRTTSQQALDKVDDALSHHQSSATQRKALPTGRPTPAAVAQPYDEASRGTVSSSPSKPAFTRGISVIDQTAVTSSAPTPAGEIQNPMSFGMGQSITRQRESHLPDEILRERVRAMSRGGPLDDIEGDDELGTDLSRQETEKAR